jgi:hypothetical protein
MTDQAIKNLKKWAFDQKRAALLVRAKVSIYVSLKIIRNICRSPKIKKAEFSWVFNLAFSNIEAEYCGFSVDG